MPVTLLDVAKATGSDGIAGLIEANAPAVPEIALIPTKPIKGTVYTATIRKNLPTVGFRSVNQGATASNSQFEQRQYSCHVLNPIWMCDKAVATAHDDGPDAFIASEAFAMTTAALLTLARQFYYGTVNDANRGFPGLPALYDSAAYQLSAGGTTAGTASSAWFLRLGPDGVQMLLGNNASLSMSPVREQTVNDVSGNPYTAYIQELLAWCGLHAANPHAAGRICNLTEDAGKGLTDARLGAMLSRFPTAYRPNAIMVSRRSLEQLRASRTATNATGAEAPTPTTYEGIPIVATDAIVNTEALVS